MRASAPGRDEVEIMGIVDAAQAALSGFGMEQAVLVLVALCLLLVVLMGAALVMLGRRSRRAEEKLHALTMEAAQQRSGWAASTARWRRSWPGTRRAWRRCARRWRVVSSA